MMPYLPAFVGSKFMGFTPGFQPTMVPSSVTNKKMADAEVAAPDFEKPLTLKPPAAPPSMLNTVPVGVPLAPNGSPGVGMLTTREFTETGVLFAPGTL